MSKEQTPIEELIENEITDLYHEGKYDYDTYSRLHDLLSDIVTKEKEQREELIKEIAIECLDLQLNEVEETYKKFGCEEIAEQYYNEVINPKYKL